jgi:hypothetical protein
MERQERRKKNEDGKSTATAVPFRRPRSSFFALHFCRLLALLGVLGVLGGKMSLSIASRIFVPLQWCSGKGLSGKAG